MQRKVVSFYAMLSCIIASLGHAVATNGSLGWFFLKRLNVRIRLSPYKGVALLKVVWLFYVFNLSNTAAI